MNKQAWLVALIFAVPMVVSLLMTFVPALRPEGGTRNYGELIEPPLATSPARVMQGDEELWLRGHWTLLQPEDANCDEACLANVDKLTRIHQALGRHHDRLQKVLMSPRFQDREELRLLTELRQLSGDQAADLGEQLASVNPHQAGLIVLDPWGNAMMRYPLDYDASAVLKDLQRLLRYAKQEAEQRARQDAEQQLGEAAR